MSVAKALGVTLLLFGLSAGPACAQKKTAQQPKPGQGVKPVVDVAAAEKKLDPALLAISRGYTAKGDPGAAEAAAAQQVPVANQMLEVEFVAATNDQTKALSQLITSSGGKLEITTTPKVFALIPAKSIIPLAANAVVYSMKVVRQTLTPAAGDPRPKGSSPQ